MSKKQREKNYSVANLWALLHDIGKIGVPNSILNKPLAAASVSAGAVM